MAGISFNVERHDPTVRCNCGIHLFKHGSVLLLAVGIIVALGGILGVLGALNVLPQGITWLGAFGASGMELAIVSICVGGAVACLGGWLVKHQPWR
ncbi:MAG: hypothetical protein KR126chlam2_00279 [Chlamydiae bacterium]|nr:hypothetical protein [Chlamydiota bacterium]